MKLFHIILLSSAVAGSVLDAGAERLALSPAVLGPHFAEAVDEALETGHYGSNMQRLIMCRDGHYTSKTCYDFVMSMLVNGTHAVRYVTRECGNFCREFPDYHCLDNCKRVQLGETYDGEFAYALHLLRKMLGMRKMTMLERWGLGFLKYVLDWVLGALCFFSSRRKSLPPLQGYGPRGYSGNGSVGHALGGALLRGRRLGLLLFGRSKVPHKHRRNLRGLLVCSLPHRPAT